jgi:hypothetical protein
MAHRGPPIMGLGVAAIKIEEKRPRPAGRPHECLHSSVVLRTTPTTGTGAKRPPTSLSIVPPDPPSSRLDKPHQGIYLPRRRKSSVTLRALNIPASAHKSDRRAKHTQAKPPKSARGVAGHAHPKAANAKIPIDTDI